MGANAVTTFPTYTTGQVLEAADLNITNCGVPTFADSTARDGAFGGTGEKTLAEGQLCYLEDSNIVQYYDGSSWATVGPATAGALVVVKSETAFSAASSVTADSVFSSTYTSYRIIFRYQTSTTNEVTIKLRTGGVSASTNYTTQYVQGNTTTVAALQNQNNTSLRFGRSTNGAYWSSVICDLQGPNLAEPTTFAHINGQANGAYTSLELFSWVGNHSTATAYDGIEFLVATGTMTGSYTIYGYSK